MISEVCLAFDAVSQEQTRNMIHKKVRAIRLLSSAVMPRYAHPGDSGLDLCAAERVTLRVGQRRVVRTGIVIEVPRGLEAQVRSRSGLARDCGVVVLNSPGTIDSGYRGEVLVLLANFGDASIEIGPGMRIAQLVFCSVAQVNVKEASSISHSKRGARGFGSTGGYPRKGKRVGRISKT